MYRQQRTKKTFEENFSNEPHGEKYEMRAKRELEEPYGETNIVRVSLAVIDGEIMYKEYLVKLVVA